jgi:exopolysaccharide biosynthesis polyprenyl glycosylphosphotransferase
MLFTKKIAAKKIDQWLDKRGCEVARVLSFAGDLIMIVIGVFIGFSLRFDSLIQIMAETAPWVGDQKNIEDYYGLMLLGILLMVFVNIKNKMYQSGCYLDSLGCCHRIARGAVTWCVIYLGLSLLLKVTPEISRLYVIFSTVVIFIFILVWRCLLNMVLRYTGIINRFKIKTVILGGVEVKAVADALMMEQGGQHEMIGWLQTTTSSGSTSHLNARILGSDTDLESTLDRYDVDIILVADSGLSVKRMREIIKICDNKNVKAKIVPTYFEVLVSGINVEIINGVCFLGISELPLDRMLNRIVKRSLDIVGALIGIVISVPIVVVFCLIIYFQSPGSTIYTQVRSGRRKDPFWILKLRSMKLDAEPNGPQWTNEGDPRRLPIGVFMRSWNIDEVPQFWNVLIGDMSLVGPRPERPELIEKFQHVVPHYNSRTLIKPGMTGWAQVHGLRGNTSLTDRIKYDLYYLENWSVLLDLKIIIMTFIRIKNAY